MTTNTRTVTSEELWKEALQWQSHLGDLRNPYWDRLFSAEAVAGARQRVAGKLVETLVTFHKLARHFED